MKIIKALFNLIKRKIGIRSPSKWLKEGLE